MNKKLILIFSIILIITLNFSVLAANNEKLYSGKKFRDPFAEYKEPVVEEKDLQNNNSLNENTAANGQTTVNPTRTRITVEDVKKGIPFSLNGIISSQNNKVALLNTGTEVEIIQRNYEYNDYKVTAVETNSIVIENYGFKLRLNMGGKVDEI